MNLTMGNSTCTMPKEIISKTSFDMLMIQNSYQTYAKVPESPLDFVTVHSPTPTKIFDRNFLTWIKFYVILGRVE